MERWKRAPDIRDRLEELRLVLGITQAELGQRAGVWPPQANNWMSSKQKPTKRRLADWADREGWPLEIFQEGGRRPKELVNAPVNRRLTSAVGQVREIGVGRPYGPAGLELLAWARQAQNAIGQVIRLLEIPTAAAPAPPEPAATADPTLGAIVGGVFPEKLPIPGRPPERKKRGNG